MTAQAFIRDRGLWVAGLSFIGFIGIGLIMAGLPTENRAIFLDQLHAQDQHRRNDADTQWFEAQQATAKLRLDQGAKIVSNLIQPGATFNPSEVQPGDAVVDRRGNTAIADANLAATDIIQFTDMTYLAQWLASRGIQ